MADEISRIVETKLYSLRVEDRTLEQALSWFVENVGNGYGLLYTPGDCFLGKITKEEKIVASSGKEIKPRELRKADLQCAFEARLFNSDAELRWWHLSQAHGPQVLLSEFKDRGKAVENIYGKVAPSNAYLFWGRSTDVHDNEWTQFAEARVGAFYVPVSAARSQRYARITAVEYVAEYEVGNIAVAEERLTGIELA